MITTPNTPAGGALTPEALADAFECFWNAAIGEARNHDGATLSNAAFISEGMNAVARRLRELAPTKPATVSADAVLALVGKLRQQADKLELAALEADSIGLKESADLSDARSILLRENADELEALTRGDGNG